MSSESRNSKVSIKASQWKCGNFRHCGCENKINRFDPNLRETRSLLSFRFFRTLIDMSLYRWELNEWISLFNKKVAVFGFQPTSCVLLSRLWLVAYAVGIKLFSRWSSVKSSTMHRNLRSSNWIAFHRLHHYIMPTPASCLYVRLTWSNYSIDLYLLTSYWQLCALFSLMLANAYLNSLWKLIRTLWTYFNSMYNSDWPRA